MLQIKLDNERAKFAFEKVSKIKSYSEKDGKKENNNNSKSNMKNNEEGEKDKIRENKKDKYLIACKNVPSQMKVNGFGMTMAYLFSKKDSRCLYNDIVDWLNLQFYHNDETIKGEEFLKKIVNADSFEYMQMSKEAMALLIWMKRFAEGMLKND